MKVTSSSILPVNVGGNTLKNFGPGTLYYRDEAPVSSSVNDGSLASGSSVVLRGTQWIVAIYAGFANGTANLTNQTYYANTIYNGSVQPDPSFAAVWVSSPVSGEFKNNIVWNASGGGVSLNINSVVSGGTWVSNYNLIGPNATNFISYASTQYSTLAAYVSGKSQDAQSIKADPLFVNAGGSSSDGYDYRLSAASPAGGRATPVPGIVVVSTDLGAVSRTGDLRDA